MYMWKKSSKYKGLFKYVIALNVVNVCKFVCVCVNLLHEGWEQASPLLNQYVSITHHIEGTYKYL